MSFNTQHKTTLLFEELDNTLDSLLSLMAVIFLTIDGKIAYGVFQ